MGPVRRPVGRTVLAKWALGPIFYLCVARGTEVMVTEKRDLKTLLEPAVTALGFELWGIEYVVRGRHRLLRVYIDGPDGVNVEHCAAVSHQISGVMDVEDPIPGEYTLEVSSPGLDRVLFEPAQFARYVGSLLVLRLRAPIAGRRRFRGRLQAVTDVGAVLLLDEGGEQAFAFVDIDKAQVEPAFSSKESSGKEGSGKESPDKKSSNKNSTGKKSSNKE